jgi:hypothetical protein
MFLSIVIYVPNGTNKKKRIAERVVHFKRIGEFQRNWVTLASRLSNGEQGVYHMTQLIFFDVCGNPRSARRELLSIML